MIVFCHIPKTAGTSLNEFLRLHFGSELLAARERSGSTYLPKDLRMDSKIYKNVRCISGHGLKPYIHFEEFEDDMCWFTFMRDPVERFVSQYIHQYTNGESMYDLSIEEWAEKYDRSNWMVKWIAGSENLEKAIEILNKKFFFVGIVEEYEDSLLTLGTYLETDLGYSQRRKEKMLTRDHDLKRNLLSKRYTELKDFYLENNSLDLQLYEYVRTQFNPNRGFSQCETIGRNRLSSKNRLWSFTFKNVLVYRPYVYLTKILDVFRT